MANHQIVLEARELQELVLSEDWEAARALAQSLTHRVPSQPDTAGLYAIGWMWFMKAPQPVRDSLSNFNDAVRALGRRTRGNLPRGHEPGTASKHEEYDPCNVIKIS